MSVCLFVHDALVKFRQFGARFAAYWILAIERESMLGLFIPWPNSLHSILSSRRWGGYLR